MFKRRSKLSPARMVREWIWPKSGWIRWTMYFWRRVWRLSDSPHVVAVGFAAGSFASFTPFMGFHFIVGFFAAWVVRGSFLASAIGTSVGNPLTFPFIWLATFNLGNWVLGNKSKAEPIDLTEMMGHLWNDLYFKAVTFFGGGSATDVPQGVDNAWLEVFWPLMKPMLVGGLMLGPCCGLLLYFPVKKAVSTYQTRRRERLVSRHLVPAPRGIDEATS